MIEANISVAGAVRCVYCLREAAIASMTVDHVIPTSWYPSSTSSERERWKVPCCLDCNHRYSKTEKTLFETIGLCVDRANPASIGISERAARAYRPSCARTERDEKHRAAGREKLFKHMVITDSIPRDGVLPNFDAGGNPSLPSGKYCLIRVPESEIQEFGRKLIRGLLFVTERVYVSDHYSIEVHIVEPTSPPK